MAETDYPARSYCDPNCPTRILIKPETYYLVRGKPWHPRTHGPFSSYTDAQLAREIGSSSWQGSAIMSQEQFDIYQKGTT